MKSVYLAVLACGILMICLWGGMCLRAESNESIDAAVRLPDGLKLFWGEEPVEELGRTRSQICLNGLWQFIPAQSETPPMKDWGYIRVPGAWSTVLKNMPGVITVGEGNIWKSFNADNHSKSAAQVDGAWYRRQILVPEEWEGRRVFVDFDRVCTDAEVFVDGVSAGDISWPGGCVEITDFIFAGKSTMLDVHVIAALDQAEVTTYMGDAANQVIKKKATLDNRGLTGDVFLVSRERGTYLDDVFIQPSFREKQLKVTFTLRDVATPGHLQVTAECINEDGEVEKRYETELTVNSANAERLEIVFDWEDPALWDFLQPNLYTLRLNVTGDGVNDEVLETFGFREFWIEGRKFMLNGTEFRLRPRNYDRNEADRDVISSEGMDGAIEGMLAYGANIQEFWPWDHYQRGTVRMLDLWCERADLMGWPVIAPLGSMGEFAGRWDSADEARTEWLYLTEREIKRLRNHPSILMWIHTPNRLMLMYDQNPTILGDRDRLTPESDVQYMKLLHGAQEANQAIRDLDPTRPVTLHHGAAAGDFQTINSYLSWIPLQEQEEWLSRYMASGDIPYVPVEFGFVPHMDMRRGRNGWKGALSSEDMTTEYGAIFFGPNAYRIESDESRAFNPDHYNDDGSYDLAFPPTSELNNQLVYQFGRNVYLSWRTMNAPSAPLHWYVGYLWEYPEKGSKTKPKQVTGPFAPGKRGAYVPELIPYQLYGMSELSMDPTPASDYLDVAFSAVAAWICAPQSSDDIAAFTAKDHHFVAGTRVEKAIALLNDTRAPQPYSFAWRAYLGDTQIASGEDEGEIATSQTLILPLTFETPGIEAPKRDGYIELSATIGGVACTDRFDFRLYASALNAHDQPLLIFDPVGKSRTMLEALGYDLIDWDGDSSHRTLVIGREAMTSGVALPGSVYDFVRRGGRVVMLQQQPKWLQDVAGFRTSPLVMRHAFPVANTDDLIEGIDAADLRDWSGHSSLIRIIDEEAPLSAQKTPEFGWHWSNRGGVSSAPIEKPHVGNWTPIIECDFGSMYSPLMVLTQGKGELLLCQLDLEDHVDQDPAVAMLCQRIFDASSHTQTSDPDAVTYYSGNDEWKKILCEMGLFFESWEESEIPDECSVLVIAPGSKIPDRNIARFISRGGRVLSLPRSPLEGATRMNPAYGGSAEVPDWPECKGLSVSDLHVRAPVAMSVFEDGPDGGTEVAVNGLLARNKVGEGVIIYSAFDPTSLDADEKTYLRLTRWRSYRVLAQLLSNLGASFKVNEKLFDALDGNQLIRKTSGPTVLDDSELFDGWYSSDYLDEYPLGDEPHRYFRW